MAKDFTKWRQLNLGGSVCWKKTVYTTKGSAWTCGRFALLFPSTNGFWIVYVYAENPGPVELYHTRVKETLTAAKSCATKLMK